MLNIFSETIWPTKARFCLEPLWIGGRTEVYSRHLDHMTKMAATPIYGKNPSNISRTGGLITKKLGMWRQGLLPMKNIFKKGPKLTLIYSKVIFFILGFSIKSKGMTVKFLFSSCLIFNHEKDIASCYLGSENLKRIEILECTQSQTSTEASIQFFTYICLLLSSVCTCR